MPTQTSAGSQQLPTGEAIYNAIMSQIEPDLATTAGIRVDARAKGESAAKFKVRMERYRKASSLYEKCFDAYVAYLRDESKRSRSAARIATEQKLHDEEAVEADKLLSEMTRA